MSNIVNCPWIHFTASNAFHFCNDLSCGITNSSDEDDQYGYLSLSLAIRIWQSLGDISPAYTVFNSFLAEKILNQCLGEETQVDRNESTAKKFKEVAHQLLNERCIKSEDSCDTNSLGFSDHWRLLINIEVALEHVKNDSSGTIIENGPRFLA